MRFIKIDEENIVKSVRLGNSIVADEIQSDSGELGQKMISQGVFEDIEIEILPTERVTLEQRVENLQSDMDYLILKQEGLI